MTGWMPDVVPDAPIESSWGNKIRNRTIVPFATTAERDGNITAPVIGMECYVVSTDSFYYYNGTAWKGRPRGRIAYVVPAAQINAPAAGTFVDALVTAGITAPETRLVRVSSFTTLFGAAACNGYARLGTGAAALMNNFVAGIAMSSGSYAAGYGQWWGTISPTATIFKMSFMATVTAGCRVYPIDANNLSWLAVEDMGTP
jgi:hypothetical protein